MTDAPIAAEPLHTVRWGTDDPGAPRALLAHGITSSAATLWELGEGLAAAGWSVTAADLPGHGGSGAAPSYRFADMADSLAALGSGWDLYLGHSLGGAVGVVLATAHPGIARRLVLLDPAFHVPGDRAEMAEDFVAGLAERDPQVFAADHPTWHPRTIEERIAASAAADPDAIRAIVAHNNWDVRDVAARVDVPVHVLTADTDSSVAPGELEAIVAAGGRHWSWETVTDTGHSLHRDRPEFVLQRILTVAAGD